MLRSLKDLEHCRVNATDGEIGSVVNFLFDDLHWTIRYLVADTGGFFEGRRVLISPISLRHSDGSTRHLDVALTRDKIKNSPSIDVDKPVSRQHERDYYRYYGYAYDWGYTGPWGRGDYPATLAADSETTKVTAEDSASDVHLRRDEEVRGYHVEGSDGTIGHIEDFIIDDDRWGVRYLVVNTRNWWFGKHVLVAPQWASRISWAESKVYVDLSRQAIKDSPEWDPTAAIDRAYETRLHEYHGRPGYWVGDAQTAAGSSSPPESRAGCGGAARAATV